MPHSTPNRWKGFILGAAGGVAGVIAMDFYWQAVTALAGQDPRKEVVRRPAGETGPLDSISLIGPQHKPEESSTAAVGRHLYHLVAGKDPQSEETTTTLSYLVHWGYGLLSAGGYGAVRVNAGVPDLPGALAFAVGLWAGGDEGAVSLLGLADGPTKFPLNQHAHRLGAHLAYGLITALTSQLLARVL